MWYSTEEVKQYKGYYHRLMSNSGLRVFRGKAVTDLSEAESKEAHQYIWQTCGVIYFTTAI